MTRWREEVYSPGLLEICMQSSGDMTIKRVRVSTHGLMVKCMMESVRTVRYTVGASSWGDGDIVYVGEYKEANCNGQGKKTSASREMKILSNTVIILSSLTFGYCCQYKGHFSILSFLHSPSITVPSIQVNLTLPSNMLST